MIIDTVKDTARKGALAYVGAVALTYDTVAAALERFAAEGKKVETRMRGEIEYVTAERRPDVTETVAPLREGATRLTHEAQQVRERVLQTLNIPTRERLEQLSQEVAQLATQIDALDVEARSNAVLAGADIEPFTGYALMNVDQVVTRLPELNDEELLAVREYEKNHSNRVTVLRAVEHTLTVRAEVITIAPLAEPFPRYDELTVVDLDARLPGMSDDELRHVLAYERDHKQRKTVIEMIEARLAAKTN